MVKLDPSVVPPTRGGQAAQSTPASSPPADMPPADVPGSDAFDVVSGQLPKSSGSGGLVVGDKGFKLGERAATTVGLLSPASELRVRVDAEARTPLLAGVTWQDREAVCDRLSQTGLRSDGIMRDNSDRRCAPSAFLAAAIMTDAEPPAALLSVCDEMSSRFADDDSMPPQDRSFRRTHLKGIEARLRSGSATLGDMHTLQQYLYDIFGTGTDGVYVDSELGLIDKLTSLGSFSTHAKVDGSDFFHLGDIDSLLDALAPGESMIGVVAADQDGVANHAVSMGRDLDGRIFLYNPGEAIGEHGHLLFRDDDVAAFRAHLSARACIEQDNDGNQVVGLRVPSKTAFSS